MLTYRYYNIRATFALKELLSKHKSSYDKVIGSQLWMQKEDSHWTGFLEQNLLQVKFLFIANLVTIRQRAITILDEKESLYTKNLFILIDELLGEPPYGADIFDKWWEIERVESSTSTDMIKKGILPEALKLLNIQNQPTLDSWLAKLLETVEEQAVDKQ